MNMHVTLRQTFQLTVLEQKRFRRLKPVPGEAVDFWKLAAHERGMDPDTVISNGKGFSALPYGHGKHWCYPIALKCKKRPVYIG